MIAKTKVRTAVTERISPPDPKEHPVREYVAAMATELSSMAWKEGDGLLAQALDVAAQLARRPA